MENNELLAKKAQIYNLVWKQGFTFKHDYQYKHVEWMHSFQNSVLYSTLTKIPIVDCIKEILMRIEIPLSYNNLERMKVELAILARISHGYISLAEVDDQEKISTEEKKVLPRIDETWRSHIIIDSFLWNGKSQFLDESEEESERDFNPFEDIDIYPFRPN